MKLTSEGFEVTWFFGLVHAWHIIVHYDSPSRHNNQHSTRRRRSTPIPKTNTQTQWYSAAPNSSHASETYITHHHYHAVEGSGGQRVEGREWARVGEVPEQVRIMEVERVPVPMQGEAEWVGPEKR